MNTLLIIKVKKVVLIKMVIHVLSTTLTIEHEMVNIF